MRYISTRGQAPPVSFLDAVLAGMAPDGGLYVPESWPNRFPHGDMFTRHFSAAAGPVLAAFSAPDLLEKDAFGESPARALSDAAYGLLVDPLRWHPAVTPLVQLDGRSWVLELFHGPSLSFKDIAMQLIGPLYEYALKQRSERLTVLCATSGDTGGAAVEAFKGGDRVDLFVLTPKARVSEVQRRFMTASGAANVHVVEVDGDFDECQAIVKSIFADQGFATRAKVSAVNSINWARIVAQSIYYLIAAHTLNDGPVHFIVPTGNFGDAYSGWVAKQLGAPIDRIVIATNANDILAHAFATGRYERGVSKHTLSPAMDIQVASNFERILFEAVGRDSDQIRALYKDLADNGGFDIPEGALKWLRDSFDAVAVSDDETLDTMSKAWSAGSGALFCPHTAVALSARRNMRLIGPIVHLATAHPAKFPETVERATGVRPELPAKCADLFQRSEKFDSLPADAEAVKQYIRERSLAWS
ncbi:MAG: threonine synthase [Hyphomonadaceae bacterium]